MADTPMVQFVPSQDDKRMWALFLANHHPAYDWVAAVSPLLVVAVSVSSVGVIGCCLELMWLAWVGRARGEDI